MSWDFLRALSYLEENKTRENTASYNDLDITATDDQIIQKALEIGWRAHFITDLISFFNRLTSAGIGTDRLNDVLNDIAQGWSFHMSPIREYIDKIDHRYLIADLDTADEVRVALILYYIEKHNEQQQDDDDSIDTNSFPQQAKQLASQLCITNTSFHL